MITQQQREDIVLAAVNCEHQIDADCIRLYRDPTKAGSALSQMVDRVVAAIEQGAQPGADVGKYDDVLKPFFILMERELHANSRKGDRPGWLAMDANTALLEVYWHTAKLSAAVKNNDGPAIQEHSADVANMAMMVLDVCGGLALVQDSPVATGAVTPCGGCGETKESSRCIGCAHQFSAAPQPQQEQSNG